MKSFSFFDSKNVSYEESNLYGVVGDLKTTSGWVVEPRIISAEEVNTITGKTDWTSTSTYYYFDSKDQTQTSTTQGSSKYAWLYDYTKECTSYGCNIADTNTYGYLTSTTKDTAGSNNIVWGVYSYGYLGNIDASNGNRGIRSVITISKSIIG